MQINQMIVLTWLFVEFFSTVQQFALTWFDI